MARFSARQLKRFMGFWPPFLGAGIKIQEFADDGTRVVVSHRPNMLTKNAMGVAFGGTLSAMTDPFFMLASMHRLGKEYRIWDAAGEIKYLKPGRGTVTADMRIPEETCALIEEKTATSSPTNTNSTNGNRSAGKSISRGGWAEAGPNIPTV